MDNNIRSLTAAGILWSISALLRIFSPVVGGFTSGTATLIGIGVVYGLIAWGLMQGWKWLACLTFVIMLVGSVAALSGALTNGAAVPGWWFLMILVVDVSVLITLFMYIWRLP